MMRLLCWLSPHLPGQNSVNDRRLDNDKNVVMPTTVLWCHNDLMLLGSQLYSLQLICRLTMIQLLHSVPDAAH